MKMTVHVALVLWVIQRLQSWWGAALHFWRGLGGVGWGAEWALMGWAPVSPHASTPLLQAGFHLFFFFKLLFKYSCLHFHSTTATSPPAAPPIPASHPRTYPFWLFLCVFFTCSLMDLPLFSTIIPLPPPLWLLLVSSLFQCVWLYFACLFVLFRFHL